MSIKSTFKKIGTNFGNNLASGWERVHAQHGVVWSDYLNSAFEANKDKLDKFTDNIKDSDFAKYVHNISGNVVNSAENVAGIAENGLKNLGLWDDVMDIKDTLANMANPSTYITDTQTSVPDEQHYTDYMKTTQSWDSSGKTYTTSGTGGMPSNVKDLMSGKSFSSTIQNKFSISSNGTTETVDISEQLRGAEFATGNDFTDYPNPKMMGSFIDDTSILKGGLEDSILGKAWKWVVELFKDDSTNIAKSDQGDIMYNLLFDSSAEIGERKTGDLEEPIDSSIINFDYTKRSAEAASEMGFQLHTANSVGDMAVDQFTFMGEKSVFKQHINNPIGENWTGYFKGKHYKPNDEQADITEYDPDQNTVIYDVGTYLDTMEGDINDIMTSVDHYNESADSISKSSSGKISSMSQTFSKNIDDLLKMLK